MPFSSDDHSRADYRLMQNSSVVRFWRKQIYQDAISDLDQLGYRILQLTFKSFDQFTQDMSEALKWQDQFGHSPWGGDLDALNDGLRGEPFHSADDNAICIQDFHLLVAFDADYAWNILDILECQSRDYLMFGKRLIALVQTNDKAYAPDRVGSRLAQWNEREWYTLSRE